jgi:hypothetical protein
MRGEVHVGRVIRLGPQDVLVHFVSLYGAKVCYVHVVKCSVQDIVYRLLLGRPQIRDKSLIKLINRFNRLTIYRPVFYKSQDFFCKSQDSRQKC